MLMVIYSLKLNVYYTYCGGDLVHFYKPTSNVSDGRLKETK